MSISMSNVNVNVQCQCPMSMPMSMSMSMSMPMSMTISNVMSCVICHTYPRLTGHPSQNRQWVGDQKTNVNFNVQCQCQCPMSMSNVNANVNVNVNVNANVNDYLQCHVLCNMSHISTFDLNPSGAYWLYILTLRWCNCSLIKCHDLRFPFNDGIAHRAT